MHSSIFSKGAAFFFLTLLEICSWPDTTNLFYDLGQIKERGWSSISVTIPLKRLQYSVPSLPSLPSFQLCVHDIWPREMLNYNNINLPLDLLGFVELIMMYELMSN